MLKAFLSVINKEELDSNRPLLTISFTKGIKLYIRYNDFGEYSYQVQFSHVKDDRIRFDNYDTTWPTKTAPHHVHQVGTGDAIDSPMVGDPAKDMPHLIKMLKQNL
ncbi:MAG: DUF6516 family protein [Candidatus Hodarchaeota archaeon]